MEQVRKPRILPGHPAEWLVFDELTACPYLPAQSARLPLRLPVRALMPEEFSERLAAGDRRQGAFLYRPKCPSCHACQAIRLDASTYQFDRTQRRVFRQGERCIGTSFAAPSLSKEKVGLYNKHKIQRGLLTIDGLIDSEGYEHFLVESCTRSIEIEYRYEGRLVAAALVDVAAEALSAVYCFYDPELAWLSLGTYSILKQIELCRILGLRHLYLGLYVEGSRTMQYKARFLPHERLIDGVWQTFESPPEAETPVD